MITWLVCMQQSQTVTISQTPSSAGTATGSTTAESRIRLQFEFAAEIVAASNF
jgi:hypothetical protein